MVIAVADAGGIPEIPYNFLALPDEQSRLDTAKAVLIPVPYDSTTSFRGGARDGPNAIILCDTSSRPRPGRGQSHATAIPGR